MNDKDSQKEDNFEEEDFVFEDEEEIIGEQTDKDKIKKLRLELKNFTSEKQRLLEDLQRAKADFVNMRRRDQADLEKAVALANESLILEIIPVLDSFDLAFSDKSFAEAPPNFKEGMSRVYNQLLGVLKKSGVTPIDPINEKFDPQVHTAVQIVETDKESEDHSVESVMQKGYSLNNKVIRSPKVIIKEFKK